MAKEDKIDNLDKRIELAMAALDKQFGKGTVMRLDDDPQPWPSISTGALPLDIILGIGGYPQGRIIEVFGPESSGKSTLCLHAVAEAQQGFPDKDVLFVDAEHALDPVYAKALGVNLPELLLSQPMNGEEAIDVLETMVRTGGISLAVVDSVAALVPKAEIEGTMDDNHMGLQPRLMARAMRKLAGLAAETNTTIIFTNQLREKIGVMFGNPETQPGGRSLKFAASVRIDIRRIESLKNTKDGTITGIRVKAKSIKNKMAPPLRVCEFNIDYGRGVNNIRAILDLGVDHGIVKQSGAWFSYEGEQLGQGADNAVAALASDMEMTRTIEKEIMSRV